MVGTLRQLFWGDSLRTREKGAGKGQTGPEEKLPRGISGPDDHCGSLLQPPGPLRSGQNAPSSGRGRYVPPVPTPIGPGWAHDG